MQMRTQDAKTMQIFDVDVLLRRGKHHLAVRRTFGKQPNTIRQLLVLQREFAYDIFRCRRTWFIFLRSAMYWHLKNAANSFVLTNKQPGNRVCSLPRRTPNNVPSNIHIVFTCRVRILIAFRCRPSLRPHSRRK